MTFPGKLEAAFGADPAGDPAGFTWTDLTARVDQDRMEIVRGRRSGASATAEPASTSVLLSAETVAGNDSLVPRKATSTYYPNVRRGLPVRYYVNQGARWLSLNGASGSRASTPDAASLDITSDIYIAVEYRSPIAAPYTNDFIGVVSKWDDNTPSRSWEHDLGPWGLSYLWWSTNGTNSLSANSVLPIPCPDQGPISHGIYLDVDNGASGHTCYFWAYKGTITELNAALAVNERRWRLGDPFVGSGTTSIFSGTAPVEIGDAADGFVTPYASGINRLEVRSGNWTGTVATNPDFTIQDSGDTSFVDTAPVPKTWTVTSPAAITDRKIRLLGQVAANTVHLPGHGLANTAQVEWDIDGLLRRVRQGEPVLESALFRRITAPDLGGFLGAGVTVDAYWPMEDGSSATSAYSPIAGVPAMTVSEQLRFGSDSTLPASKALPTVAGAQPFGFDANIPASTTGTWEVTWLTNIPTPSASASPIMVITANGTARRWLIQQNSTQITVSAYDIDGAGLELDTLAWSTNFEYWSIARLEAVQNGANIDWIFTWIPLFGPGAGGGSVVSGSFAATCGRVTRVSNLASAAPPDGLSMGHVAVTSGTLNSWLAGADQAYVGEVAAARAYRLCVEQGYRILVDGAYAQFDTAANLAAGEQAMGPQRPATLTALLEECAKTANGHVGEATEILAFVFRSGWTLYNQDPAITTTSTLVPPYQPTDDDRDIVNDATVTRTGGSSARHEDSASINAEGRYPDERTVNTETDIPQLANHASWWTHETTVEEMRIPSARFELAKNTGLVNDWLATCRGDKTRLTGLPAALPESSTDQLLDGWTEAITQFLWTITANGRPAVPFEVTVLDDDTRGKLDTAGSELASGVTTTATSLSVATTLGGLWDPADAEDGFDIHIGGERMTVTDISGTSSPQTFTVTRSVNGVVKTHSAGAAVNLWTRPALAL